MGSVLVGDTNVPEGQSSEAEHSLGPVSPTTLHFHVDFWIKVELPVVKYNSSLGGTLKRRKGLSDVWPQLDVGCPIACCGLFYPGDISSW